MKNIRGLEVGINLINFDHLGKTDTSYWFTLLKRLFLNVLLIFAVGIILITLLELFPPLIGGIFAVCAVIYLCRRFLKEMSDSFDQSMQKERSFYSSLDSEIKEADELNRNNKFEEAIEKYKQILLKLRWKRKNHVYAKIKFNLGSAYRQLACTKGSETNIALAMKCFEEALKKYKLNKYPNDYAKIKYNMAEAYRQLSSIKDKETNIHNVIESFEEALKVCTQEKQPILYAGIQIQLGKIYMKLPGIVGDESNISKAIIAFENALKVCTLETHKLEFADIQSDLGFIYTKLSVISNKETNTLKAINAYEEALKVYNFEKYPQVYAATQSNLGYVYGTLAQYSDKDLNMKKALIAFEEALKIFTEEKYPDMNKQIRTNRAVILSQIFNLNRDTESENLTIPTDEIEKESLLQENSLSPNLKSMPDFKEESQIQEKPSGTISIDDQHKSRDDMIKSIFLQNVAEYRQEDPFINAKVGGKEIFYRIIDLMKDNKGVHIESLLCAVGALAGYSCQASIRAEFIDQKGLSEKDVFLIIQCQNGSQYYFGEMVNKPLAENQYSIWSLAAGAVHKLGLDYLLDLEDIFVHVSKTVGTAEYGIPRIPEGHKPGDIPQNYLKYFWPRILPVLKEFCPIPEWPILFGITAQEAIFWGKDVIDPHLALLIIVESAIPMAKIDFKSL